jgi:tetratricopeptide (TPR) repeat protein
LNRAQELAPGDADVIANLGYLHHRRGDWDEALRDFQEAVRLDPGNEVPFLALSNTLAELRRFPEAEAVLVRLEAFAARPEIARQALAYLRFVATGDITQLDAVADRGGTITNCDYIDVTFMARIYRRQFVEAERALAHCQDSSALASRAHALVLAGNMKKARPVLEAARAALDADIRGNAAFAPELRLALAYILAGLLDREGALKSADSALTTMPVSRDASRGAQILSDAATFHAYVGEIDRALDEIEQALSIPSAASIYEIQLNPDWDRARSHPRYKKLVADHPAQLPTT